MILRGLAVAAFLIVAAPAGAQTPEVPLPPPHKPHAAKPHAGKPVATHAAAAKPVAHKAALAKRSTQKTRHAAAKREVPVVAPRHGAVPRKPVAKATPVITPPAKAVARQAAPAKPAIPADQGTVTGLHLPRYASLKTGDVNMRSGPGGRYPVLWDYRRAGLPVRIVREFDVWRLVEDMDGTKGWIHQATLAGRRTFVITGADPRTMRADSSDEAAAVAVLKPGVVGRIKTCAASAAWCQVQVGDYKGWLARADFWGTDAGELVVP